LKHKGEVYAAAFSPDGKAVATGDDSAALGDVQWPASGTSLAPW